MPDSWDVYQRSAGHRKWNHPECSIAGSKAGRTEPSQPLTSDMELHPGFKSSPSAFSLLVIFHQAPIPPFWNGNIFCATVCENCVICLLILQAITFKRLFWVSEASVGFWAVLRLRKTMGTFDLNVDCSLLWLWSQVECGGLNDNGFLKDVWAFGPRFLMLFG